MSFRYFLFAGGMVTRCTDTIKLVDPDGIAMTISSTEQAVNLGPNFLLLWKHCMSCLEHCMLIEKTLSTLPGTTFPVTVGRRPASAMPKGKENIINSPQMVRIIHQLMVFNDGCTLDEDLVIWIQLWQGLQKCKVILTRFLNYLFCNLIFNKKGII